MNVDNISVPTMLTIDETAERTGLAKFYIRKLVINNEIYHLKAGRKYLVNYEKFLEYLEKKQEESLM